jgi:hypothetical protein
MSTIRIALELEVAARHQPSIAEALRKEAGHFRVQAYFTVTQFAFRVYIAALIVAFIATRYQRPELAALRLKALAFVNT